MQQRIRILKQTYSNDKLEVTKVHTKDATNVENMAAATKDAPRSLNTPHEQFCSIINQKLLEGDLSVMNGQLEHDNIVNHTTKAHVQRDMNVTPKGMGKNLFYHTQKLGYYFSSVRRDFNLSFFVPRSLQQCFASKPSEHKESW